MDSTNSFNENNIEDFTAASSFNHDVGDPFIMT